MVSESTSTQRADARGRRWTTEPIPVRSGVRQDSCPLSALLRRLRRRLRRALRRRETTSRRGATRISAHCLPHRGGRAAARRGFRLDARACGALRAAVCRDRETAAARRRTHAASWSALPSRDRMRQRRRPAAVGVAASRLSTRRMCSTGARRAPQLARGEPTPRCVVRRTAVAAARGRGLPRQGLAGHALRRCVTEAHSLG